ncbi:hypothetical protein FEE95_03380 [Maribacter algarum]|uniref:TerB family tellurite resistance protein n=1 Tax=Maribacter algarum (ex Zhang et al. 2020) TaxID=2578118 RepID=A0A5S3PU10_9FLAO|nr:hypothetical protein [Maribacter algarum]TMM58486.1 hypothetical protein FEE95_03380 [Maribacter algarum]
MKFTQDEKLAVASTVIAVIKADKLLHMGEIKFMERLKKQIGIDIPTVEAADDLDRDSALVTLHKMTYQKKKALVKILREAAISDDFLHETEMDLILQTFSNIGLGEELD